MAASRFHIGDSTVREAMVSQFFQSFIAALTVALALTACEPPAKLQVPTSDSGPARKSTPFSRVRVFEKSLREFNLIQRPLKAYFAQDAGDVEPTCRKTTYPAGLISETKWACGTDPKERGRKEIIGTEFIRYDKSSSSLTYIAKLTITNFEDLEPRAEAHSIEIQRRIVIQFSNSSSRSRVEARVSGSSRVSIAPDSKWSGSNYEIKFSGHLAGDALNPTLADHSVISFSGSMWGEDELRGTFYGSGAHTLGAAGVNFQSSATDACLRPVGSWQAFAENASGEKTGGMAGRRVNTSLSAVEEEGGLTLEWAAGLCNAP